MSSLDRLMYLTPLLYEYYELGDRIFDWEEACSEEWLNLLPEVIRRVDLPLSKLVQLYYVLIEESCLAKLYRRLRQTISQPASTSYPMLDLTILGRTIAEIIEITSPPELDLKRCQDLMKILIDIPPYLATNHRYRQAWRYACEVFDKPSNICPAETLQEVLGGTATTRQLVSVYLRTGLTPSTVIEIQSVGYSRFHNIDLLDAILDWRC